MRTLFVMALAVLLVGTAVAASPPLLEAIPQGQPQPLRGDAPEPVASPQPERRDISDPLCAFDGSGCMRLAVAQPNQVQEETGEPEPASHPPATQSNQVQEEAGEPEPASPASPPPAQGQPERA